MDIQQFLQFDANLMNEPILKNRKNDLKLISKGAQGWREYGETGATGFVFPLTMRH